MLSNICFANADTYEPWYVKRLLQAAQSLLVIVSSPPSNPDYTSFRRMVDYYNQQPPFEFRNSIGVPKAVHYFMTSRMHMLMCIIAQWPFLSKIVCQL